MLSTRCFATEAEARLHTYLTFMNVQYGPKLDLIFQEIAGLEHGGMGGSALTEHYGRHELETPSSSPSSRKSSQTGMEETDASSRGPIKVANIFGEAYF